MARPVAAAISPPLASPLPCTTRAIHDIIIITGIITGIAPARRPRRAMAVEALILLVAALAAASSTAAGAPAEG
jgi:hypothetical protein